MPSSADQLPVTQLPINMYGFNYYIKLMSPPKKFQMIKSTTLSINILLMRLTTMSYISNADSSSLVPTFAISRKNNHGILTNSGIVHVSSCSTCGL